MSLSLSALTEYKIFNNNISFSFDENVSSWNDTNYVGGSKSPITNTTTANFIINQWAGLSNASIGNTGTFTVAYKQDVLGDSGLHVVTAESSGVILTSELVVDNIFDISTDRGKLVFSHELGHAFGLRHPNDDPFDVSFDQRFTIMSYLDGDGDPISINGQTNTAFDRVAISPMALDIAYMQALYGGTGDYNNQNTTVYGTGAFNGSKRMWTIFDTAGESDRIDVSGLDASITGGGVTIDLRESLEYLNDNGTPLAPADDNYEFHDYKTIVGDEWVYIARGTVIENATGGGGNDTIYGNSADNSIEGGAGADQYYIEGNFGQDRIKGGELILYKGEEEGAFFRDIEGQATDSDGDGTYVLDGFDVKEEGGGLKLTSGSNTLLLEDWIEDDPAKNYGITIKESSQPYPQDGEPGYPGDATPADPIPGTVGTVGTVNAWYKVQITYKSSPTFAIEESFEYRFGDSVAFSEITPQAATDYLSGGSAPWNGVASRPDSNHPISEAPALGELDEYKSGARLHGTPTAEDPDVYDVTGISYNVRSTKVVDVVYEPGISLATPPSNDLLPEPTSYEYSGINFFEGSNSINYYSYMWLYGAIDLSGGIAFVANDNTPMPSLARVA